MSDLLPPPDLDRTIQGAAGASRRARRELRSLGPAAVADPLRRSRPVSTRTSYLELAERPSDPFYAAARPWVYALTLDRVLWAEAVRVSTAWHAPTIVMEKPERLDIAPRALLHLLLRDDTEGRRELWAEGLARGSGAVADAARVEAERRAEAQRLLDADGADAIEIPCDPPAALATIAEDFLARTNGLVQRAEASWASSIAIAIGRRADEGWPAHLTTRWLRELFEPTQLTAGLSLDVGTLPEPIGGASFARALAMFGAAYAEADVPRNAPFVFVRAPFDLRVARRAALFGQLPADPLFGMRALGLGRDRARDQARVMARALLLSARLDAARVLLRGASLLPRRDREHRFEELTDRALGAPIPPSLAGVVPELSPGDAARFAGIVVASADAQDLVQRFDEDWFRSPHAAEAIRDEQGVLPARPRASAEELAAGLDALDRRLHDALG